MRSIYFTVTMMNTHERRIITRPTSNDHYGLLARSVLAIVLVTTLSSSSTPPCGVSAATTTPAIFTRRWFGMLPQRPTLSTPFAVRLALLRGGAAVGDSETNDADTATPTTLSRPKKSSLSSSSSSSTSEYRNMLQSIQSNVVRTILQNDIEPLRIKIAEQNSMVDQFGTKCDEIINSAMELFDQQVNALPSSTASSSLDDYDTTLTELVALIDTPLQLLYLKLLGMIRDTAMETYRTASATSKSTYDAMVQADQEFVRLATAATRSGSNNNNEEWDYNAERQYLQSILSLAADASYKTNEVQLASAQQQQTAMTFLQSQQQMIQQLQSQLYGQTSPWNVGMAYRIPDTNFNIQGSYQQGRANVQLSCVPDEYAPFLGPNGFTNGVGPGNLGLSLNLSL